MRHAPRKSVPVLTEVLHGHESEPAGIAPSWDPSQLDDATLDRLAQRLVDRLGQSPDHPVLKALADKLEAASRPKARKTS
jgi:hypothetical protein